MSELIAYIDGVQLRPPSSRVCYLLVRGISLIASFVICALMLHPIQVMAEIRSPSSSPDPLEYPGDPKFLLSSATKSIPRRLSFTPRRFTPRLSAQPTRKKNSSIKPLKFQDIVLPATPSGGKRGHPSVSPSKTTMHSEGNVSPWRIRVTVEAEREDEEGEGGGQNSVTPWTNGQTTKVPLKGTTSTEPTPKRRKTPRRKSVTGRRATPGRKKSLPPRATEKKKRGRPRKSSQPTEANNETPTPAAPEAPTFTNNDDPFFDIAMDTAPPGDSHVNEQDTGMYGYLMDTAMSDESNVHDNGETPRPQIRSQIAGEARTSTQEGVSSQPMSTQQIEERSSPANTLHAGRTPRPKRQYPTPTSSSVLEENGGENRIRTSLRKGKTPANPSIRKLQDPTEEHREYDSILEGEDFSMVSLDTLPSAKQSLSGPAKAGLSAASAALSASQRSHASVTGQERPEVTKRSPQPIMESEQTRVQTATRDIAYPTIEVQDRSTLSTRTRNESLLWQEQPPPAPTIRRKPLARLRLMIHMGLSLVRVFNRHREFVNERYIYHETIRRDLKPEAVRQRLEDLFSDFGDDIKRLLHAGLWFGAELANRIQTLDEERTLAEKAAEREAAAAAALFAPVSSDIGSPPKITSPSDHSVADHSPTPQAHDQGDVTAQQRMDLRMAQQEAEWQREREEISRQIDAANSNQVIVLDEDEEVAPNSDHNVGYPVIEEILDGQNGPSQNGEVREAEEDRQNGEVVEEEVMEEEPVYQEHEDDDGYDIWQQEANQPAEPSLQDSVQYRPNQLPKWEMEQEEPIPGDPNRRVTTWSIPRSEYSNPSGGRTTQLARYRDGNFDFSSLLGTPESATRRFYQGGGFASSSNAPRDGLQSAHLQRVRHYDEEPQSYPRLSRTPESERPQSIPRSSPPQRHSADYNYDEGHDEGYDYHADNQYQQFEEELADTELPERSPTPDHRNHFIGTTSQSLQAPVEQVQSYSIEDDQGLPQQQSLQQESTSSSWFINLTAFPFWLTGKVSQAAGALVGKKNAEDQTQLRRTANGASSRLSRLEAVPHSSPSASKPKPRPRRSSPPQKALALGGYFTDDHYEALYRLYKQAKQNPDAFPYEPTPERDDMLGRVMTTKDGSYPRLVTEFQIAVAVRFLNDLVEASRRRGGSDQLGFTELEIVWRVWSIIVGGKIRRERKLANRAARASDMSSP